MYHQSAEKLQNGRAHNVDMMISQITCSAPATVKPRLPKLNLQKYMSPMRHQLLILLIEIKISLFDMQARFNNIYLSSCPNGDIYI